MRLPKIALGLVCGALLASSSPLVADIGPKPRKTAPGVGLPTTDMEGIEVEMTSEVVNLTLRKSNKPQDSYDYLDVEVSFNMTNLAEEVSFEEGFPIGPYKNMVDFSISVDGKQLKHKLVDRLKKKKGKNKESSEKSGGRPKNHDYWYVWDTTYKANQVSKRLVKYTVNIFHFSQYRHTGYILHTGAAWKNKIKSAVVNLRCKNGFSLDHITHFSPRHDAVRTDNTVTWTFKDLEPGKKDNISIAYNRNQTWREELAEQRKEAQITWNGKVYVANKIKQTPARYFRSTLTDDELSDYLDALEDIVSEFTEKDGKIVVPTKDKTTIKFSGGMPKELREMLEERMGDQYVTRNYAEGNKGGNPDQIFDHFKAALNMATKYNQSERAKEVLSKYKRVADVFIDGQLYADDMKLCYTGKNAETKLSELRETIKKVQKLLDGYTPTKENPTDTSRRETLRESEDF